MATAKPSKLQFAFRQGALRGFLRGLLLAEIYTLLVAVFYTVVFLLDSGGAQEEFLGFLVFILIWGQLFGVIPALLIGLVAGFTIARVAIELSDERKRATASRLAAGVALLLTLLVDLFFINGPADAGYLQLVGFPTLIFVFEAVRVTLQQLHKVEAAFSPGGLQPRALSIFFWVMVALKLAALAWMLF
jgi:type III secretory pathway component EscV